MGKELIWSKDSISLNRTIDDSLDLLFCQDYKKVNSFRKQVFMERSVSGLIKLIKEIW